MLDIRKHFLTKQLITQMFCLGKHQSPSQEIFTNIMGMHPLGSWVILAWGMDQAGMFGVLSVPISL